MSEGDSKKAEKTPANLLGPESPDRDWKLEPTMHAQALEPEAAALKRVLEHSAIKEIMRRYSRHDEKAAVQQSSYKNTGKWEIYLSTVAAILGGAVLLMNEAQAVSPVYEYIRIGLLVVQITCAAGVVALKYLLKSRKPFEEWQKARTEAETARIELFETVCGLTDRDWHEEVEEGDYPLLPLQLEYFIRYQLQVQLIYYDERGKQHLAAANRYVSFGAVVTFVAALAAGLGGLALELVDTVSFASMAAMVAPILLSAQTSLSRLNQDERNAARYAITHAHLDKLSGRLTDVRNDAAAGNAARVHSFIHGVNEVISVEHSEWKSQLKESASSEEDQ